MALFTVKDLSFFYPNEEKPALSDIGFSVEKGEFITICGSTGSGKSTLLKLLKPELSPKGILKGSILFDGENISDLPRRLSAEKIGYVTQNPEMQIVTDKVWHELAFSLESLGLPEKDIARRVMETASFFGIDEYFEKKTSQLSGGQKQLLNLACACAAEPSALILDEPCAQLDPAMTKSFLSAVKRLCTELSITVIIAEHRLEEIVAFTDRLMMLEKGRIFSLDTPKKALSKIASPSPFYAFLPSSAKLWQQTGQLSEIPLSVREGRSYLETFFNTDIGSLTTKETESERTAPALTFKNVYFRYERNAEDVLKDLSLEVYENEIFCILGPNASGKTTALMLACAVRKPYAGSISVFGKNIKSYKDQSLYRSCISYLPQDVTALFLKNTVREELEDAQADQSDLPFDPTPILNRHPYDLSGGEQELLGLSKVLASCPRLLLLDEPTKGLDPQAKETLKKALKKLKSRGMTVVIVTHDVEFSADIADRCALLFKGECICTDVPLSLFSQGQFYTTAISRMTRGLFDDTVTVSQAAALCEKNGRRTL